MSKPKHPDFERLVRHYIRLWGPSDILDTVSHEIVEAVRDGAVILTPGARTVTFAVDGLEFSLVLRVALPEQSAE